MDEKENEQIEETLDEIEEIEEIEETDKTDWKAEAEKARGIAQRLRTKNEKLAKAAQDKKEVSEPAKKEAKTGELDETQLDYLDLKGISDQDEINVIQKVIEKTGQTVRQVLKDDYVTAKLEKLRADKAVKDAMPSDKKRGSGNTTDAVATALSKFKATKELPDDFELRSAVVNALAEESNSNKPSWH